MNIIRNIKNGDIVFIKVSGKDINIDEIETRYEEKFKKCGLSVKCIAIPDGYELNIISK